jgi:hypothetical protein
MSSNPNILGVPKQKGCEKRGNMHEGDRKTMNTFWWKFQRKIRLWTRCFGGKKRIKMVVKELKIMK